jgi:hypothetical protein
VNEFPFDTHECCPACGERDEDGVLCEACCDMVRNDPRTFPPDSERVCGTCGEPADALGWCEGMRRYMDCFYAKRVLSDSEFLTACGIAPFSVLIRRQEQKA